MRLFIRISQIYSFFVKEKAMLMRSIFMLFFISVSINVSAQQAVVSSYYNSSIANTSSQSNEWTELFVVQDNLDMRNWTLGDNNGNQTAWQTPITFNNIPFWSKMRAGTIITIWHRNKDTGGIDHAKDISPDDGYIELWANDPLYFTGGDFTSNNTLHIANSGDLVQLKNGAGNHIHALGHISTVPTAGSFNSITGPKLNHTSTLANNSAIFIVPGTDITYYGTLTPLSGTTYTNIATGVTTSPNVSFGLPNSNVTWLDQNSDFWRSTRQPDWITPLLTATPNGSFTQVTLTWNPCVDPYPTDATQGYIILKNTSNSFADPVDGISYIAGALIGPATVVANITSSTTTAFTDNTSILCGENMYYRIYTYRYSADNSALSSTDVARGRAYNETNFGSASVSGPTLPTVADAGPTQSLCGVLTATLSGNNPLTGSGLWSAVSGPGNVTFGDPSINNTTVSVDVSGTYIFSWTISNGATCPPSSDDVTVTFSNAVTVVAGSNSPVCTGEDIQLTSSISEATYSWTGPDGFISNEQNPFITNATLLQAGNYNVTVTGIPGGCPTASNSTIITVNPSPISPTSVSSNITALCAGDPGNMILLASGGSGDIVEWFTGSCGGTFLGTGGSLTIANPDVTTTYYARWSTSNCGNSLCNSVTVSVTYPPVPSYAGNDQAVCGALTTTLEGNNPLIGTGTWSKELGPGTVNFSNTSLYNSSVTVLLPGIYVFRWTISNGEICPTSFDDVTIEFSNTISVSAGSNSPICNGDDIQLSASISGASYNWTGPIGFNSNEQYPTIPNPTPANNGFYKVTVSDIPGGCPETEDSTYVVVGIMPTTPAISSQNVNGTSQDVCEGSGVPYIITPPTPGSEYNWNISGGGIFITPTNANPININWTSAGVYVLSVTETTSAGCIGTPVTLSVIVSPPSTASISIIPDNNPVCRGTQVTFTATPTNGGTTPEYTWFVNGIQRPNSNSAEYTYIPNPLDNSEEVHVRLNSSSPCAFPNPVLSGIYTLTVTDNVAPVININTPTTSFCPGDTAVITADANYAGTAPMYSWFKNGNIQAGETSDIYTFIPNDGDAVFAKVLSNLDCASPPDATSTLLSFNVDTTMVVGLSIAQQPVLCNIDPVTVVATPSNTGTAPVYEWYLNGSLVPGQQSATYSSMLNEGDILFARVSSSLSCATGSPATSNNISISKPVLLEITQLDTVNERCGGRNGSIAISTTGGTGIINFSILSPPVWVNVPVFDSLSASIIYTIQVKDENGCVANRGMLNLSNIAGPSITASGNGHYCTGDTVVLQAESTSTLLYEWIHPSGNTSASPNLSLSKATTNDSGLYHVIATDQTTGCTDTASLDVQVHNLPDVNLGMHASLCTGTTYTLTPGPDYTAYLWHDGSTSPTLTANNAGLYYVKATDQYGCSNMDSVTIENCSEIFIPTAFSPNRDGKNEYFRPVTGGIALLDYTMLIYNRWGQKIFETNNFVEGWDGTHKGSDIPSGMYTYFITYRTADPLYPDSAKRINLRGQLMLVK